MRLSNLLYSSQPLFSKKKPIRCVIFCMFLFVCTEIMKHNFSHHFCPLPSLLPRSSNTFLKQITLWTYPSFFALSPLSALGVFFLLQTTDVVVLCNKNSVSQLRDIQVVSRNLHNRLVPQATVSTCNRDHFGQ